jgi:hypothetical protein
VKRVAIVQSCYIPWKGYFDMINCVDEFILLDEVQFTKRDWRNRNTIKTPSGKQWLTIPVRTKGQYFQRIDDTVIDDLEWRYRHWKSIVHNYASARCFTLYRDQLEAMYGHATDQLLSHVNRRFLEEICTLLAISTPLTWSTDYGVEGVSTERLVNLCRAAGANVYLSGPRARAYLDEGLFVNAGIAVEYMDYTGYPEYEQLYPPFDHAVTILDLILSEGSDAPRFMKTFSPGDNTV